MHAQMRTAVLLFVLAVGVGAAPVSPSGCPSCQFTISAAGVLSRGGQGCDPSQCTGALVLTGTAAPGTAETGSTTGGVIITLDPTAFIGLSNIDTLDLRSNQIAVLPHDVFSGLTGLKTLKLSFNKIAQVPVTAFKRNTALQTLQLDNNVLGREALPDLVFNNNAALSFVFLNNNKIPSLPLGVFEKLVDTSAAGVQVIDLRGQLGASDTPILQCYPPLSQRSLQLNGMSRYYFDAGVGACKGVAKCQTTAANSPQACMFFIDSFGYLSRGKDYGASNTGCSPDVCVGSLDFSTLTDVPKITKFSSAFTGLVNIEFLYLGTQNLGAAAGGWPEPKPLKDLGNVKHLDLSGTWGPNAAITVPPVDLLYGLSNLEWLDMSTNGLTAFPPGFFDNNVVLTTLNLEGNKLATMPDAWLSSNKGLVEVFMSDNQLTSLPATSFSLVPNLAVGLDNNPNLACIPNVAGIKLIDPKRVPTTSTISFCSRTVN